LLSGDIIAVSLFDSLKALVLFAAFLYETAGDEVLQFFVGTKAEHFFSTTDCVACLQELIDRLKKVVKSEELSIRT